MPEVHGNKRDKEKGPAAVNEGAPACLRRPPDGYVPVCDGIGYVEGK